MSWTRQRRYGRKFTFRSETRRVSLPGQPAKLPLNGVNPGPRMRRPGFVLSWMVRAPRSLCRPVRSRSSSSIEQPPPLRSPSRSLSSCIAGARATPHLAYSLRSLRWWRPPSPRSSSSIEQPPPLRSPSCSLSSCIPGARATPHLAYWLRSLRSGFARSRVPDARGDLRYAETVGSPASQNRHGTSAAADTPTRGPLRTSPGCLSDGSRAARPAPSSSPESVVVSPRQAPRLPGPLASRTSGRVPRRSRTTSSPSTTSPARSSTADEVPSVPQTMLTAWWIPYEK